MCMVPLVCRSLAAGTYSSAHLTVTNLSVRHRESPINCDFRDVQKCTISIEQVSVHCESLVWTPALLRRTGSEAPRHTVEQSESFGEGNVVQACGKCCWTRIVHCFR